MPKLIAVVGPTASGKTALAVEIARAVGGEVVSCDSRQVYRGLDLGTGKVTGAEARGVPHHLIDVASPSRAYSVARFERDALRAIRGILDRGKVPILCGGTGLYADAAVFGAGAPDVPPNPALRRELAALSAEEMAARLDALDPERAASIDRKNRRRLERAIEIAEALGSVPKQPARSPRFETLWIGIAPEREELHRRIETRLDARLRRGMVAEARRLRGAGLPWSRFEALGLEYRWLGRFLRGEASRPEMRDALLADIRRYAKRQMTWFRRNKLIGWYRPAEAGEAVARAASWVGDAGNRSRVTKLFRSQPSRKI
jgi:tRNA dimethylallyltransferase